ncbi:MAG: CDP-glycerol glycerophosphotransferase family protein, partial [Coriobacteriales bacterium]|nr:CDP-glycerol glycerophosphotransferase family protein [Coriobacteriales bacterium]
MSRGLRSRVRGVALGILRAFPRLRRGVRKLYWRIRVRGYDRLSGTIPVEENVVFFESYEGRSCSCSPQAMFLAMCADERFSDWHFIWSFREGLAARVMQEEPLLASRALLVSRGSDEYFAACARAKYWVVNSRMPEWIGPKLEQVFVQCWHGTPLKRLGHDILIETKAALNTTAELQWRYSIDAAKWSCLLSPSPFTSECLASAFDLKALTTPPRIIEEGYPRNDGIVQ